MIYMRFVNVITNINVIKCFTSRNSKNAVNIFAITLSKKLSDLFDDFYDFLEKETRTARYHKTLSRSISF